MKKRKQKKKENTKLDQPFYINKQLRIKHINTEVRRCGMGSHAKHKFSNAQYLQTNRQIYQSCQLSQYLRLKWRLENR